MRLVLAALALSVLSACASGAAPSRDRFDVLGMQRTLDDRGIGFGLTRVPGEDAVLLQLRFRGADASGEADPDPRAAAEAVAPDGCTVSAVDEQPDGTFKVTYAC